MRGHDRTVRGAMRDLLLAVAHLNPQRIGTWVDGLTHTNIPPALRRPVPHVRLSALDQSVLAAAEFARAAEPPDIGYIEESR